MTKFADYLHTLPSSPLVEAITTLYEAESDGKILKMATDIANQFFSEDTLKQIVGKFDDMESLAVFGNKEDFTVSKEITEPVHLKITAYLGRHDEREFRTAETLYTSPPTITFFLSDQTGKLRDSYDYQQRLSGTVHKEDIIKMWKSTAIHEISHALDLLLRGSPSHSRSSKSSLRQTKDYEYANDLLETNARIPQIARLISERVVETKQFPSLKQTLAIFDDKIMAFENMSDDTKRRTAKRVYDIYSKMANIWKEHANEISDPDDFMKYLNVSDTKVCHIVDLLGDEAEILTSKGGHEIWKREKDSCYEIIKSPSKQNIGAKMVLDKNMTYNPTTHTHKVYISKIDWPNGESMSDVRTRVKIKQLKKPSKN